MVTCRAIVVLLFVLQIIASFSQDTSNLSTPFSSNSSTFKNPTSQVSFSGFYRFLGYTRVQNETFPNNSGKTVVISSGDFFREPMLLLKINGTTRDKILFGADLMINSLYKGPSELFTRQLTLDLGLNLKTSIATNFGNFSLRSGGVSWYRQSRLTVWGNR